MAVQEQEDKDGRRPDYLEVMYDALSVPLAIQASYTRLDTYRTCPRKYKHVYVDKEREPPSEAMLIGHAVHSALEVWLAVDGQDVGDLLDIFTASVESQRKEGDITVEEEELARTMLLDYYDSLASVNKDLVLGIEEEFNLLIPGVYISGIIDRAEYLDKKKDTILVTDYKSGRSSISQQQAKKNLQMAIYTLAAMHMWPAERYITQLVYPRLNKSIKHEFTLQELQDHIFNIQELGLNMRLDHRFKPTGTPPICGNCGYKHQCPWGKKMDKIWQGIKRKREAKQ